MTTHRLTLAAVIGDGAILGGVPVVKGTPILVGTVRTELLV
jgi:hypothetical protein